LDAAMPRDTRPVEQRKETAEDISQRPEVHITALESKEYENLATDRFPENFPRSMGGS
jgi:hypothetical protein